MKSRIQGLATILLLILVMVGMGFLAYFGITITDKDGNQTNYFSFMNIKQGLDLKGGVYIVFEAENPTAEQMKGVESIIRNRLDSKGYLEATVSIQGSNRLRVEIPDVDDADAAVEDIGKTAQLMFVDEEGQIILTGSEIIDAKYQEYTDMEGTTQVRKSGVSVTFSSQGRELFSEATANNVGKVIYIILDNDIISSPVVQQHITSDTCSITGDFTLEEADYLAMLIKSGALPVPLSVMEVNRVGAQLGSDALAGSLKAGVVGTALVLVFMLIMYRLSGFAADLALCFFILMELLVLSVFKVTLTLPGIAGIILTIGMAVDANVVIFERMKEELNQGKTVRTSIEAGFRRAMPAILDGNITTIIAGFVLFALGTGPIKGFAQTLILGVMVSMLTAIFITRAFVEGFHKAGINSRLLYGAKGGAKA